MAVPFLSWVSAWGSWVATSRVAALVVGGVGCGCLGGVGCSTGATLGGVFGAVFSLIRMSVGLGGGWVASLGGGLGAGVTLSLARTDFSTGATLVGKGMAETMEAWMAPTDEALSPQCSTWPGTKRASPTQTAAMRMWSAMAPAKPLPKRSGLWSSRVAKTLMRA